MSLQIQTLTSFTFQFLQQSFLQQLKKQAQTRSKPSKAVLQALKHSSNLNKSFKTQLQTLKSQLSLANQENQFLKSMIENLKSEVDFLKTSKQDKLKKFYELQFNLMTKVEFLNNQNCLLKKQIQILKCRPSQSHISIASNSEKDLQFEKKINAFVSSALANSINNSQPGESSVCLDESSKFNEYVNFESVKKQNHDTQPNSKFKIELQQSNNFNTTQKSTFGKTQCEQLTKMLNLRHESNDYIDDEDPLAHQKSQFSSTQQLAQPNIIQIASESQFSVDEQTKPIQSPTLNKLISESIHESKFKVFAENKRQLKPIDKGSEFTFLNLDTRKSIEEGKSLLKSIDCTDKPNISFVKNGFQNSQDCLKLSDDDILIDNISGVDYVGLMEDIENGQDPIEQSESVQREQESEDFFCQPSQNSSKSNQIGSAFNFERVLRKRTSSEIFSPQKINSVILEVRKHDKQYRNHEMSPKSPSKSTNRHKQEQKVTIAIHQPPKYMTVADSYKTIDLSKQNKNVSTIQHDQKITHSKKDLQTIKNSSSLIPKSRGSPRSMINSKLMVINNARKNQRNKTFTPLSIQNDHNQNELEQPKSPSSLRPQTCLAGSPTSKSYSLIQSSRLKNMMASKVINNKSMIENSDSQKSGDHCLMGNYSSFRKKIQEKRMITSIHPTVNFNHMDEVQDEQTCEMNENDIQLCNNDEQRKENEPVDENI